MNWAFVLGWVVSICSLLAGASSLAELTILFGEDGAAKIAAASGLLGFVLGFPLSFFNARQQVLKYITEQAEDPLVKPRLVQMVSNLSDVAAVAIEPRASPELKHLEHSKAPENAKIISRPYGLLNLR